MSPEELRAAIARLGPGAPAEDWETLARDADGIPSDALERAGFLVKRLAVLPGYTIRSVTDAARGLLLAEGIRLDTIELEYGTFEQALIVRDPRLASFAPAFLWLCVGAEHLALDGSDLERWRRLWSACQEWLGCQVIQNTFEEPAYSVFGSLDLKLPESRVRRIRELNLGIAREAPAFVHLLDVDGLAARHGRAAWREMRLFDVAKIPCAADRVIDYARALAKVVGAALGRSKKALVLDLDNTLWGGIVGDDGQERLEIGDGSPAGEAHARLQRLAQELRRGGVLLAVCSKNEASVAEKAIRERSEMLLGMDDFSAFRASWDPKPANLASIARELNIGLDSLVFVDDSPYERELVRQALPAVTVVELGEDPADFADLLAAGAHFDRATLTEEDLARTEHFVANRERGRLQESAGGFEEFLASLGLTARIGPVDEASLARVTQLINKTNQFNVTTPRMTEDEVRSIARDPRVFARWARVSDRFGDYGLVSVLIAREESGRFEINAWLMSCRVLKRRVEHAVFLDLAEEALARGVRLIRGRYLPTEKNRLVEGLYEEMGFRLESGSPGAESSWVFDVAADAVGRVRKLVEPIQRLNR